MKRKFTFLLSLILGSMTIISAQVYDFKVNGVYYKKSDDTHVNIVSELGSSATPFNNTKPTGAINIPATVSDGTNTYTVSGILSNAFRECSGITSVIIAEGITTIGANAFRDCTGMVSIQIPQSVTSFGTTGNNFQGCTNLTTVNLPTALTAIPVNLFYGCGSLTSIDIPEGVTSIPQGAFNSCKALQSIVLPDGITSIGNYAFSNCTSLTSINLPLALSSLGNWALGTCTSLTTLTIPADVTSINNSAFRDCTSLTSLTSLIENPSKVTLGNTVFGGIDKSIPLIVPSGTESLYRAASQWEDFINIGTGVDQLAAKGVTLVSLKGALDITLEGGQQVMIHEISGKLHYNDFIQNQKLVKLPSGVYLIKVGAYSGKVVVK